MIAEFINYTRRGILFMVIAACALFACSDSNTTQNNQPLPPGFTDAPPAPPTSNTMVLSGGTLLVAPPVMDAAIVISNGKITAWGERGAVSMPNDSIGHDMRGKWLLPTQPLRSGQPADMEIYDRVPRSAGGELGSEGEAVGYVRDGVLTMLVADQPGAN